MRSAIAAGILNSAASSASVDVRSWAAISACAVGLLGVDVLAVSLGLLGVGHLGALELCDLRLELVALGLEGLALVTLLREISENSSLRSTRVWVLAVLAVVLTRVGRRGSALRGLLPGAIWAGVGSGVAGAEPVFSFRPSMKRSQGRLLFMRVDPLDQ
ncbi:hypothetical protein [Corynebacterium nasicanis]|uniref:Uncharacterized protein n=1 Tax=Corynebacterium nasicanis TaxID=1448267 RepID=A0ABW1Q8C1_9CORY